MSDFNPLTLFFYLLRRSAWLWLLFGLALVLLIGIVVSVLGLHRAGRSMKRPIAAALIVGLIAAAATTFAVLGWTLADIDALGAVVDYAFAFLFALVPGAIVASLVFLLAATRCAARGAATVYRTAHAACSRG